MGEIEDLIKKHIIQKENYIILNQTNSKPKEKEVGICIDYGDLVKEIGVGGHLIYEYDLSKASIKIEEIKK